MHCPHKILDNCLSICNYLSSHHQLWDKICQRLLSLSMMSSFLHVPTRKMQQNENKLNLLNICKVYIEYIEMASFNRLTT
jgi:hypothetical protein